MSASGREQKYVDPLPRWRAFFVLHSVFTLPIQVDNALIKRATGGPKRFRPKIREELELEVGSQRGAASDGCVRVSWCRVACGVVWRGLA